MKKTINVLALIILMTILLFSLAACNNNTATPASPQQATPANDSGAPVAATPTEEPLVVGCLIPFTGLETHNGLAMQYASQIAADEINAAGGVLGRQVKLVFEDTACDPNTSAQKAIKMIQSDKVDMLVGTLITANTYAVFDIANKNEIIFMNPTFYPGTLYSEYFFCTGSCPNQVIYPVIDYLTEQGMKSYYFVASDYVWGTGSVAAAKRYIEEIGGTVVGEDYVPMGITDYTSIITNIQNVKPDVVFPFAAGTDGVTFAKQLDSFGLIGQFQLAADYFDELLVPALEGSIVDGMINSSDYYTYVDTANNKTFLETLKKNYNSDLMCNFGANMYHNIKLYCQAVEKAGTTDALAVAEALRGSSIEGLCGNITIDPETHHSISDTFIAEIQADRSFDIIRINEQVMPLLEEE